MTLRLFTRRRFRFFSSMLWRRSRHNIHGTFEPWTIGKSVSSGCIRMINQDVIDLYQRVPEGAKVVVLGSRVG